MSVLTQDILIEGIKRDDVLTWLATPANHARLVEGAFDTVKVEGEGRFTLTLKTGPRTRELTWKFEQVDEEHGGRRVHVALGGKRTTGKLHFSLRTMKPAGHTLVTLHADIDTGGVLGLLAEQLGLRDRLGRAFAAVLENLKRALVG